MPITAAYAEPRADGQPDPANYRDWLTYTWAFNLTRNPSASIPCGMADGLPIGLMVTGPLYDDLGVLQACHAYEQATAHRLAGPGPHRRARQGRRQPDRRRQGQDQAADGRVKPSRSPQNPLSACGQ